MTAHNQGQDEYTAQGKNMALLLLAMTQFVIVIDASIVNVALPSIGAHLHFARDDEHFRAMLRGTWRVLRPGGLLFCRLASTIGMETRMRRIAGRRFLLPDGSERYLVDEALLVGLTEELGGRLADPLE